MKIFLAPIEPKKNSMSRKIEWLSVSLPQCSAGWVIYSTLSTINHSTRCVTQSLLHTIIVISFAFALTESMKRETFTDFISSTSNFFFTLDTYIANCPIYIYSMHNSSLVFATINRQWPSAHNRHEKFQKINFSFMFSR